MPTMLAITGRPLTRATRHRSKPRVHRLTAFTAPQKPGIVARHVLLSRDIGRPRQIPTIHCYRQKIERAVTDRRHVRRPNRVRGVGLGFRNRYKFFSSLAPA